MRLPECLEVPARGSVEITVVAFFRAEGPLNESVNLFLDDGSLREVTLTIMGTAVKAKTAEQ